MFTSLRSRLIGSYVLIIVICLAVTGIALTLVLVPQLSRLTYLRLADKSLPTALHVRSLRARRLSPEQIVNTLEEQASSQATRILIVTAEGTVLADTEHRWAGRHIDLSTPRRESGDRHLYIQGRLLTAEGVFFYVAIPTSLPSPEASDSGSSTWYVTLLSRPRQVMAAFIGEVTLGFILTGMVALLVSVGIALLIARSIAKPLQRITAATEEIARGNYDDHLNISSPDEVRRLAKSFNTMTGEVKASRQAQRDFVANVSHDLKTPLTSIRGFSQAILDGAAADKKSSQRAAQVIHEEAERMAQLVDDLLELARIDAGQVVMAEESVPLCELLQTCIERIALRAEQAEVAVDLQLDGNPIVRGDRDRLAQVLNNLLDNALIHTPSGGRVVVAARTVPQEAQTVAEISVADTGAGIQPEELPRIFERFYRGDKSRANKGKGTGLGLAIAREIILAHGGQIRAESVVGLGSKFTITLPEAGEDASPKRL